MPCKKGNQKEDNNLHFYENLEELTYGEQLDSMRKYRRSQKKAKAHIQNIECFESLEENLTADRIHDNHERFLAKTSIR